MSKMSMLANPKHVNSSLGRRARVKALVQLPFVRFALWCGFRHVDYAYVHGNPERVHVGDRCSTVDTVFNVSSGDIWIGEDTYFGHGCQVLTGEHRFYQGRRAGLQADSPFSEVPKTGNDIRIGRGCFIGSASVVTKGVTIGDDVIVAAGAVVTSDLPPRCLAAGVPARVVKYWELDEERVGEAKETREGSHRHTLS